MKSQSPTGPALVLAEVATRASDELVRQPGVRAVALIGSVARGDARDGSDVDLVVLVEEAVSRTVLRAVLPPEIVAQHRVSLIPLSTARWLEDAQLGNLFVHHVRQDGCVLSDSNDLFGDGFRSAEAAGYDVAGEIRRRASRLRLYRDPRRFNGRHLLALAQLYAIGKGVVIARCVQHAEPTFRKDEAFRRLAAARPDWQDRLDHIDALRPFYDLTHERGGGQLPFPPRHADDHVTDAVEDIEALVRG